MAACSSGLRVLTASILKQLYWRAVKRRVAFVPGKYFFLNEDDGLATMRLNFTMSDEATIQRAIETLGEVVRGFSAD